MTDMPLTRRGLMGALVAGAAVTTIDLGLPTAAQSQARPSASRIDAAINDAYNRYRSLNEGKNADYIPALAQVPSSYFGIATTGPDGAVHEVGNSKDRRW